MSLEKNYQNGTVLVTHIEYGVTLRHYAVVVNLDSVPYVMSFDRVNFAYIEKLSDYLSERKLIEVRTNVPSLGYPSDFFMQRYSEASKLNYDLLAWNCEHFTDFITGKEVFSWQVLVYGSIGAILMAVVVVSIVKFIIKRNFSDLIPT